MIVVGIILLLLYYLLPGQPPELLTAEHVIGWILVIVGAILWLLGAAGHRVGPGVYRGHYW